MNEQTHSRGAGAATTAEEVKVILEERVKAAVAEGAARLEIAEPEGWWNLWALGPIQITGVGGPLLPHKVVKTGEDFYVATVLWLNPNFIFPGGVTACQLISNLACDFVLDYCTGDLCTWTASQQYSRRGVNEPMVPDQCWYLNVQKFTAAPGTEGCYQMSICGKITGCEDTGGAPPLAGFATAVLDYDPDLFYPTAGPYPTPLGVPSRWEYDIPIRFQIY